MTKVNLIGMKNETAKKNEHAKNSTKIRPYGDHWDDGKMQTSFTLPLPAGELAKEAARLYLESLGFVQVLVAHMEPMGSEHTMFVAYVHAEPYIDISKVKLYRPDFPVLPFEELKALVDSKLQPLLRHRIVVVGAATGSDAHTVGIDAILSIKGVAGDKGLEYYPFFKVVNLRAQVSNEDLIEQTVKHRADAVLVSKFVTQQDQHLKDLKELAAMIGKDKRLPSHLVKIAGGPRMDHRIAKSVGFDAGFGPGTKPSEVANFIVHEISRKVSGGPAGSHETRPVAERAKHAAPKKKRSLLGWLAKKD